MAHLSPSEREAIRQFATQAPLPRVRPAPLPFVDYLRWLATLPPSLRRPPRGPARGNQWRL